MWLFKDIKNPINLLTLELPLFETVLILCVVLYHHHQPPLAVGMGGEFTPITKLLKVADPTTGGQLDENKMNKIFAKSPFDVNAF